MVNDFAGISQILDALGVKPLIGPLIAIVFCLFLIKKYLFNGFGPFLKESIKEWLQNEKERIAVDIETKGKLSDVHERLIGIENGLENNRRYFEERIGHIESQLRDHIAETRNLLLLLKKKTDRVNEDKPLIDTQYFKTQAPQGGQP